MYAIINKFLQLQIKMEIMKTTKLLLGAHVSIAGGLQNAFQRAHSIGCTAFQIFTQSNRQWSFKVFTQEEVDGFNLAKKATGIERVITHASYLINLGSNSEEIRNKSLLALKSELARCDQLGIKYLVLHPGSGSPKQQALQLIADGINEAFKEYTNTQILLELMAGQGSSVGSRFEDLALIRDNVEKKQLTGICFDTCHAWAAGYTFNTPESYEMLWQSFDEIIGLEHLKAFHINDSAKTVGCCVDRHANIGQGTMGLEPFKLILNDSRFNNIPKIIETPKEKDRELQDDLMNLEKLRSLIKVS